MARKLPKGRSLNRQKAKHKPKLTIYAFCEGKNSEPGYLTGFCQLHGNKMVELIPLKAQGVPYTIVNNCVDKIKLLNKKAKKSKDPLDLTFEVWAIFDRDEHPKIEASFDLAKRNGIYVAYSDPCIEIWPLLHFKDHRQHIHRHDLQKQLATFLDSYKSDGSKEICALTINKHFETAKRRAIALDREHQKVGTAKANPYTDIYKLLDTIIANGIIKDKPQS